MVIINDAKLPDFIFYGICDAYLSHAEPKENELSTTTLNKPMGMVALTRNHDKEITVNVSEIINSAIGTIVHQYFEGYAKKNGYLAEQSVERAVDVNGKEYTVTGRFDFFNQKTGELVDLKLTKVATFEKNRDGRDDEWKRQGASYSDGIERKYGYAVKKFTNVCFILDYSAIKKNTGSAVQTISYDMTTPESQEFIAETLDIQDTKVKQFDEIRNLPDEKLPLCSAEERWEDQSYAVMKTGRKTAVRCFATEEEANEFIEELGSEKSKHFVEHRTGNPKRCLNYCTVRNFCPYYLNNVKGKGENE